MPGYRYIYYTVYNTTVIINWYYISTITLLGGLLVGDQLLEANGVSLVGVSNEKYIVIEMMNGQTDKQNEWMDR